MIAIAVFRLVSWMFFLAIVSNTHKAIKVFLSRSIPKANVDSLSVNHDVCGIVIEHRGFVGSRE